MEFRDIAIGDIEPNPRQPRKHFEGIEELALSLLEHGQIMPLLVRPMGEGYQIVHGERRWRAAKLAGLETLRVEIRDLTDEKAFRLSLVENVGRQSLTPMEEARAFELLIDEGTTQENIGKLIGKSQQYVQGRLSLLNLTDVVQELITTRAVNASIATRLVPIWDDDFQEKMARRAARGNLSVKQLEKEKKIWKHRNTIVEENRIERGLKTLASLGWDDERTERYTRAIYAGNKAVFIEITKDVPHFQRYIAAVNKGEIRPHLRPWPLDEVYVYPLGPGHPSDLLGLEILTMRKEFTGQDWHWPKYSGLEILIYPGQTHTRNTRGLKLDAYFENMDVPLFSQVEWDEWADFDQREEFHKMLFWPVGEWFIYHYLPESRTYRQPNEDRIFSRRTYDHAYGHFLVWDEVKTLWFSTAAGPPYFVRQGWGKWVIVEFNDGEGGRIRRRYFTHAHEGSTMITQAMETVDPVSQSDTNFRRMEQWKVAPVVASWWYIRRKTIDKDKMIAAIEKDLARLRAAEPLTDEELHERTLEFLQNYTHKTGDYENREGVCSYPRLPDGTIDIRRVEEMEAEIVKYVDEHY